MGKLGLAVLALGIWATAAYAYWTGEIDPFAIRSNGEAVEEADAALQNVDEGKCDGIGIEVMSGAMKISAESATVKSAQVVPSIGVGVRRYHASVAAAAEVVLKQAGCK